MFNWASCEESITTTLNGKQLTENVVSLNCLPTLVQGIINTGVTFIGVVCLFMLVYAGIRMTTAGGDAKQLDGSRKMMTYAVIGLLIVMFSFVVINFISKITGVTCLTGNC